MAEGKFQKKLAENYPSLVEEYAAMSKEQLLEQICAEVLDLHAMDERVQTFMNECTMNLSKTTYTIPVIKGLIADKQQYDLESFCAHQVEALGDHVDLGDEIMTLAQQYNER